MGAWGSLRALLRLLPAVLCLVLMGACSSADAGRSASLPEGAKNEEVEVGVSTTTTIVPQDCDTLSIALEGAAPAPGREERLQPELEELPADVADALEVLFSHREKMIESLRSVERPVVDGDASGVLELAESADSEEISDARAVVDEYLSGC
jgi:hypothetical protein